MEGNVKMHKREGRNLLRPRWWTRTQQVASLPWLGLWTQQVASLPRVGADAINCVPPVLKSIVVALCLLVSVPTLAADFIQESARKIPLVKETDVLVVGGSSGAVTAALAAKAAGADVYLVAPRPYLGEDIAGTLRLGLEDGEEPDTELAQELWLDRSTTVPFTYKADAPGIAPHADKNGTILSDGRFDDVVHGSVQYDVPKVKINADFGEERFVESVELVSFKRRDDFAVASARFVTSTDGKTWSSPIQLEQAPGGMEHQRWVAPLNRKVRYVGLAAFRRAGYKRMLLGEITFRTKSDEVRRRIPTPLMVKQTFDRALLTNGVEFITGSYVTDVLRDKAGAVAGVVIANRSGRQAIKAKTVVDATERATVARLAGVPFTPYPAGDQTFTRIVISLDRPEAPGMTTRLLPGSYRTSGRMLKGKTGQAWECTLKIPMKDGSYASFAEAEQIARDRTFTKGLLDAADTLFQVPPDRATGSVPHVFVLGGCAAADALNCVPPAGGSQLAATVGNGAVLRPLAFMRKGTEVGAAAARDAAGGSQLVATVAGTAGAINCAPPYDTREFLTGLRPFDKGLPTVDAPASPLPVLGEYDVVVVGGGTAGAPAGIGAGRRGAKTLLIEYLYGLGGVGTLGMIGKYWYGNRVGFTSEHDKGVAELGASVHVVGKREWWRRENRAAGVELWFGAMACGAVVRGGRVSGVVVATPQGRGVVLAKDVVDATGNADVAAAAGARCSFLGAGEIALQGAGLAERRLGESYINSDWGYVNDSDAVDLWLFGVRGRAGAANGTWDISQVTDSRERRRIVGAVTVSPLDVVNERTFPDTIAQGRSDFDSHGPSVDDICYVSEANGKKIYGVNIPYRAILPEKMDGLAVVGLGISAHRDALPLMRMQPDVQNAGYAAGVAAAMASEKGMELRAIDVKALQHHLVEKGVIPEEVLSWEDNAGVDTERWLTAVRDMGDGYKGVSIVLSDPERAVPALRDAYAKATTPSARLVYAHVLGILGDATGAETLAGQVSGRDPQITINAQGLAAFGRRMPERDSFIVALGRTRSPCALEPLLDELTKVNGGTPVTHVRALSLALEALRDPRTAPALAAALAKPGISGWARPGAAAVTPSGGFGSSPENGRCLRELNLARALYACGDHEGVAKNILESYAADGRGVFALHARAVLGR